MNYVSWQHESVLLEGYPPGSVGQQGLVHITEGSKRRAGLDHDFGHPQEIQPVLVAAMRHILLRFSLCWRKYSKPRGNFLNALGIGCLLH